MRKIVVEAKIPWFQLDLKELYGFRWVFVMLILRDFKLRYKQTFLGVAWVVLQPLLTTALFTLLFGHVLHLSSEGVPYSIFAFCGLVPWLFFSQALQRAHTCLINDTRLITKVYFPRIFIPLSATFGVVIDFLISLSILFGLMVFYGIPFTTQLFFFPICGVVLFAFSSGINLFFSSITVYFRDFKHIVPFLIQFWMYASPLAYSTELIPKKYLLLYSLNPLVGLIDAFRWSLLGLEKFPLLSFAYASCTSFFLLVFGTIVFRRIERGFADVI